VANNRIMRGVIGEISLPDKRKAATGVSGINEIKGYQKIDIGAHFDGERQRKRENERRKKREGEGDENQSNL